VAALDLGRPLSAAAGPRTINLRVRDLAERLIIVRLAGAVAEARAGGEPPGDDEDVRAAYDLVTKFCGSDEEAEKYLEWLRARAVNLLNAEENWLAVDSLAAELLERRELSGREARRVFKIAWS
jgi:hypothetical protein